MKVSTQWLQEYIDFPLPDTTELVERIGAQLGAVEETTDLGAKYVGAVVVKVIECSKLENSDHLNLCFVDDGGVTHNVDRRNDGLVQVVCGAPNVKVGAFVAWLPPGATVPSTYDHDPFVLQARELRGTVSNGMLASAKELAIGDSHQGLLLLDDDSVPGTAFAKAYKLDDHIIDIENKMFTHRPDCFGQLGVAREVAGILGKQFSSPDWYATALPVAQGEGLPLTIRNELPNIVPRFMAVTLKNATITASPIWLQTYLSRVGVRPINNVVDITNYMMLLTGQPLHAYDYDKVARLSDDDGATIVIRYPHENEQIELLSGKTITPRAEAIIIATNTQAIGLGGVMGGGNTEVDEHTQNIILECATFNMYVTRRTSMAHGLFTDAVTRFNKGQSPLQNPVILAKAAELLQELSGAVTAGPVLDEMHDVQKLTPVEVTREFVNSRLGLELSITDMTQLLTNVEFAVEQTEDSLAITPPFWRTDIEIPEDIVEEIGRLHGFDKLPLELPVRSIMPAQTNALLDQKADIASSLAKSGANELLTYSFVHGNLLEKVTQQREQAFKLSNALSPDLQYYRLHALPSLLDKVHANIKAGYPSFALFELNKGHNLLHKDDAEGGVPTEIEFLDFVYASKAEQPGAPFYHARRYLDALAADLGLTLSYVAITEDPHVPVADPYDYTRSAFVSVVDGPFLGMVGEFKPQVLKSLKLPKYSAGFTVGQNELLEARTAHQSSYQALPRYPKVEQDLCLRVASDVSYADLSTFVAHALVELKPEQAVVNQTPLDIYQRDDDAGYKQITFRLSLANFEKTMTDQEMGTILDSVSKKAHEAYGAERI
jgi:phenylalanyl-tRNA synthetase beta chain